MKKVIKYGIFSVLIFTLVCASLSSCGDKKGGANATKTNVNNGGKNNNNNNNGNNNGGTAIDLAGNSYSRTDLVELQPGQQSSMETILQFNVGGEFVYKLQIQNQVIEMFKGTYTVANNKVAIKITWENPKFVKPGETMVGATFELTIEDSGNKISETVGGKKTEYTKK